MTDIMIITALITSITSMVVSILTHVRYSKCCSFEIETRDQAVSDSPPRSRSNSGRSETDPLLKKNINDDVK